MLGKLIKHEWKDVYKVGCLMLIIIAGITFFGWLAFQSPMWKELTGNRSLYNDKIYGLGGGLMDLLSILTLLLYVLALVGVSFGILIFFVVRFYKTMYTDEGYLTHTLPVTKHQILCSKILVDGVWMLILQAAMTLSVIFLVMYIILSSGVVDDIAELIAAWREIVSRMGDALEAIYGMLKINMTAGVALTILTQIFGSFIVLTTIFGAISMGQLFAKARVFMAIVSYCGILILRSLLRTVFQWIAVVVMASRALERLPGIYMNFNIAVNFSVTVLIAVLMYFVSYWVTSSKLNLE